MEMFLNREVVIDACLGGPDGSGCRFKGRVTSYDGEFVCLDNKKYIVRKFILAITVK